MTIQTNTRFCKGCGICVELCPKKVLELDELKKIRVVREADCSACRQCELRCPDYAIAIVTDKGK
jgi:2-oxoglutarate ferredoxin oxidoreductase subunit delta